MQYTYKNCFDVLILASVSGSTDWCLSSVDLISGPLNVWWSLNINHCALGIFVFRQISYALFRGTVSYVEAIWYMWVSNLFLKGNIIAFSVGLVTLHCLGRHFVLRITGFPSVAGGCRHIPLVVVWAPGAISSHPSRWFFPFPCTWRLLSSPPISRKGPFANLKVSPFDQ